MAKNSCKKPVAGEFFLTEPPKKEYDKTIKTVAFFEESKAV